MNAPLSPLDQKPASSQAPPSDASAQWGLGNPALHSACAERSHGTLVEASRKLSLTVETPGTRQKRTRRQLPTPTPAAERKRSPVSPPKRPDFQDSTAMAVGTVSHLVLCSPDPPPRWPRRPAWQRGRPGAPAGLQDTHQLPGPLGSGARRGPQCCLVPCPVRAHVPAAAPGSSPTMQRSLARVQLNTKHLAPFQRGCQDLASRELQGSGRLLNPFTFLIRSTHPCL